MFGGADPSIDGLVPADIVVKRNHFAKPLQWRETPGAKATWTVKNLFELKNARRVLVDGNLLEYNWPAAQNGFAVLLTVRNQSGGAPWSVVEDVTFSNNVVRHVGAGVNILGSDDIHPSRQTRRIAITNNLFADVGGRGDPDGCFRCSTDGRWPSATTPRSTPGSCCSAAITRPTSASRSRTTWPCTTRPASPARAPAAAASLDRYFPAASVRGNVLIGSDPSRYPSGNNFFPCRSTRPASWPASRFVPAAAPMPVRAQGSDGLDVGADIEALTRMAVRVASPRACGSAPPVDRRGRQVAGWPSPGTPVLASWWCSGLAVPHRIRTPAIRSSPGCGRDGGRIAIAGPPSSPR
jgi:hypothetical protein